MAVQLEQYKQKQWTDRVRGGRVELELGVYGSIRPKDAVEFNLVFGKMALLLRKKYIPLTDFTVS